MRSKSQILSKLRADGHITDEEYKALEQEPKTIQEKQAESEKYQIAYDNGYDNGYAQARFDYEQEPKTGYWVHNKCDVCGASRPPLFDNYCPNCGAKMVEPQERSE